METKPDPNATIPEGWDEDEDGPWSPPILEAKDGVELWGALVGEGLQ